MTGTNKYKLIDLFAGAGGLSNGFEQTKMFEVIGAVEINKDATKTYIKNHNNNESLIIKAEANGLSDITKIDFKELKNRYTLTEKNTIVIGGPPCQGFSNANRQKNYLISGNNQLVKEYARAIDELRPIAFLMENVKTMNSKTHKFFVTEHEENSILKYSSEKHLNEIRGTDEPFWQEEELVLIETVDKNLENLIYEIISCEGIQPILLQPNFISRIRSLMRKLNSSRELVIKSKVEIKELEKVINYLNDFVPQSFGKSEELQLIIKQAVEVIKDLLNNVGTDKEHLKIMLQPFITINQLLRYLKELQEERISTVDRPFIELSTDKLIVKVKVKSYNIVEYLERFFKYLNYDLDHQVIKAVDYFVPQKRERYMFLGVNKDYVKTEVKLPERLCKPENHFTVKDAILDLEEIEPQKDVENDTLIYNPKNSFKMYNYFRGSMENSSELYNHVNTESEELSLQRFAAIKLSGGKNFHSLSDELKEITYTDSSRTQNTVYLRLNYEEPSPTVINVRKSMWQHPDRMRAVSIREAARLQTFKDNFVFVGSKDKQYQQIGNAVPPLMARAVAEQMLTCLGHKIEDSLKSEFK